VSEKRRRGRRKRGKEGRRGGGEEAKSKHQAYEKTIEWSSAVSFAVFAYPPAVSTVTGILKQDRYEGEREREERNA
jgi:hypothetical protein